MRSKAVWLKKLEAARAARRLNNAIERRIGPPPGFDRRVRIDGWPEEVIELKIENEECLESA